MSRIGLKDVLEGLMACEAVTQADMNTRHAVGRLLRYEFSDVNDKSPKTASSLKSSDPVQTFDKDAVPGPRFTPVPFIRNVKSISRTWASPEPATTTPHVQPEAGFSCPPKSWPKAPSSLDFAKANSRLYLATRELTQGSQPHVSEIVRAVSRGLVLSSIPKKARRTPISRFQLIIDTSWALAPAHSDMEVLRKWVQRWLSSDECRVVGAEWGSVNWPQPIPGWTTLVVSDGGGLSEDPSEARCWSREGYRRREMGERAMLWCLVPPVREGEESLEGWDYIFNPFGLVMRTEERKKVLEQLLSLASLVVQVESGLLREMRQLITPLYPDIELYAWNQQSLLSYGRSSIAHWSPEGFLMYNQKLIQAAWEGAWLTPKLWAEVLNMILRYRILVAKGSDEPRYYWVSSKILSIEISHLETLVRDMPASFKDVFESFYARWRHLQERGLSELVSAASSPSESSIDRQQLVSFFDCLKLYVPSSSWMDKDGVFYPLANALATSSTVLELTVSQDAGGLGVAAASAFGGSPVATLISGTRSVNLESPRLRTVLKIGVEQTEVDVSLWREALRPNWANKFEKDRYGQWASTSVNGVELKFRWIEPGTFWMGSPDEDDEAYDYEKPRHQVTLSQGYWLAETPCTQALWQAVTGTNPSRYNGESRPVENVSWDDVEEFLQQLNQQAPGLDAQLPTEAQWEYACRAGTETPRYGELDAIAWYDENSGDETHPVGEKQPNAWGLYDMLGNVWEWCRDGLRYYDHSHDIAMHGAVIDPMGPMEEGADRVLRGGSWSYSARYVRAASRYRSGPSGRHSILGFRLARGHSAPSQSSPGPGRPKQATEVGGPGSGGTPGQGGARGISSGITLVTDRAEAQLDIFERPAWASRVLRDKFGLYADVKIESSVPVFFKMRWIPPGEFYMGSPNDEVGRLDRELQHLVRLTQGYWLAATPCTQQVWQVVTGKNPSEFKKRQDALEHPVEQVSWYDVQEFMKVLNERVPGLEVVLPTEAQWEYACRAGTQAARYGELDAVAWYYGNSDSKTHPVGRKAPNTWGLYDTLGNVWEWCANYYDASYGHGSDIAMHSAVIDPIGPAEGALRVLRGGGWGNTAGRVRAAHRYHYDPSGRYSSVGFRLARGHSAPSQSSPGPGRPKQAIEVGGPGSGGTPGQGGAREVLSEPENKPPNLFRDKK